MVKLTLQVELTVDQLERFFKIALLIVVTLFT